MIQFTFIYMIVDVAVLMNTVKQIFKKFSDAITSTLWNMRKHLRVRRNLDRQLAPFLKRARGGMSYAEFSRKTGLSHTTLHRLERGEHHLTLQKLGTVLNRLKLRLKDIFPEEF